MTVAFALFSLNSYWKERRSLGFWAIFLGFLGLQMFGVGRLWMLYNGLSTLVVGLVGAAEWVCMVLVIYWVLGVGPDVRRHAPKSRWTPTV
jgi:hypothetical protein